MKNEYEEYTHIYTHRDTANTIQYNTIQKHNAHLLI
jgi:hypothetical protein